MNVPFVDLHAQYLSINPDVDAAIARAIARSAFIGGDELVSFETEFARYCEVAACVGVGNGTLVTASGHQEHPNARWMVTDFAFD